MLCLDAPIFRFTCSFAHFTVFVVALQSAGAAVSSSARGVPETGERRARGRRQRRRHPRRALTDRAFARHRRRRRIIPRMRNPRVIHIYTHHPYRPEPSLRSSRKTHRHRFHCYPRKTSRAGSYPRRSDRPHRSPTHTHPRPCGSNCLQFEFRRTVRYSYPAAPTEPASQRTHDHHQTRSHALSTTPAVPMTCLVGIPAVTARSTSTPFDGRHRRGGAGHTAEHVRRDVIPIHLLRSPCVEALGNLAGPRTPAPNHRLTSAPVRNTSAPGSCTTGITLPPPGPADHRSSSARAAPDAGRTNAIDEPSVSVATIFPTTFGRYVNTPVSTSKSYVFAARVPGRAFRRGGGQPILALKERLRTIGRRKHIRPIKPRGFIRRRMSASATHRQARQRAAHRLPAATCP